MCDVSCVFVTFPYGVPGQVWYLIVSILDLCLLYFHYKAEITTINALAIALFDHLI